MDRAMRCFVRIMLYREVDAQCDKLANVERRKYFQLSSTDDSCQFMTLSVIIFLELGCQHAATIFLA